jgi:hypothetical protein
MKQFFAGEWVTFCFYVPWYDNLNMKNSKKLAFRKGRVFEIDGDRILISGSIKNHEIPLANVFKGTLDEDKEYVSRIGEIYKYYPKKSEPEYIIGKILSETYKESDQNLCYTGTVEHNPFNLRISGKIVSFSEKDVIFGTPTFEAPFLDLFVFRLRHNFLGDIFHFERNKVGYVQVRQDNSWLAFTQKGDNERGVYLGSPCERSVGLNLGSNRLQLCLTHQEARVVPNSGRVVYVKALKTGNSTVYHWFRPNTYLDSLIRWVQTDGTDKCFREKNLKDLLNMFGSEGTFIRSMMEGYFLGRLSKTTAQFFSTTGLWQFLPLKEN